MNRQVGGPKWARILASLSMPYFLFACRSKTPPSLAVPSSHPGPGRRRPDDGHTEVKLHFRVYSFSVTDHTDAMP